MTTAPSTVIAPNLHGVVGIWMVIAVLAVANAVTYSSHPQWLFVNVSLDGIASGLHRFLQVLKFPIGFVAFALFALAISRLLAVPGAVSARERRLVTGGAVASVMLVVFTPRPWQVPPWQDPSGLTAVVPAVGVAIALGITIFAVRRTGLGRVTPQRRLDTVRIAVAAFLCVAGLPWFLAVMGIYVDDVPHWDPVYMSKEPVHGRRETAVHLGHHHGLDGVLFALAAVILSRTLHRVPQAALRRLLAIHVGFMLVYGVANTVEDFWLEQVVRRGLSDWVFPLVHNPAPSVPWALLMGASALVGGVLCWRADIGYRALAVAVLPAR